MFSYLLTTCEAGLEDLIRWKTSIPKVGDHKPFPLKSETTKNKGTWDRQLSPAHIHLCCLALVTLEVQIFSENLFVFRFLMGCYLELQLSLQSRAEAKCMLPHKKLGGTLMY